MTAVIEVKDLSKSFGDLQALKDLSFTIHQGEIFGFLGPSGSGKTTTINILTRQMHQDSGKSRILGVEITQLGRQELRQIGKVGDDSAYYEKLTLEQNLKTYALIHGVAWVEVEDLLQEVGLADHLKKKVDHLSTGMRQRMLLVRALIHQPRVLFLDEPTSGIDPMTSQQIHRLLMKLKAEGVTIFLTTMI